jgi:uncharacterized membrane protein
MTNVFRTGWAALGAAAILAASGLIAVNSLPHLLGGPHPFLAERPQLAADAVWRAALATHVTGGVLCHATGPVLVWNLALRRSLALHRLLGRAYVVAVLGWAGPAGVFLALHAKGGFLGRTGFLVFALAWIATTWLGWRDVRRGRVAEHARWMVRSYSLALSAIHFRVLQLALVALGASLDASYVAALWLSLLASVAQGEALVRQLDRFGSVRSLVSFGGSHARDPRVPVAVSRPLLRVPRADGPSHRKGRAPAA